LGWTRTSGAGCQRVKSQNFKQKTNMIENRREKGYCPQGNQQKKEADKKMQNVLEDQKYDFRSSHCHKGGGLYPQKTQREHERSPQGEKGDKKDKDNLSELSTPPGRRLAEEAVWTAGRGIRKGRRKEQETN